MDPIIVIMFAFAIFYNIVVIKFKYENGQITNANTDLAVLALVMWVFSGSEAQLAAGAIASALFSTYLFISPPNYDWLEDEENEEK